METVLVSACLLGVNCKYDGTNNELPKLMDYLKDKRVIPVCPEQMGGFSTPRMPSERKDAKVMTESGIDVTKQYQKGAQETLKLVEKFQVEKAILKSKSPSCGVGKIYDGTFSHTVISGNGVTADLLLQNGVEVISSDDFL